MSPPPTNIDGQAVDSVTIDGQAVDSVTVDGQTVFSSFTDPVALSNLVAWYPFDPSAYSGMTNNADDATAGLSGAGNSTAFDGTVNGATYQSSGGVTDINAGANSGAFEFFGSEDINLGGSLSSIVDSDFTIMCAVNPDKGNNALFGVTDNNSEGVVLRTKPELDLEFTGVPSDAGTSSLSVSTGTFQHVAATFERSSGNVKYFVNSNKQTAVSNVPNSTSKDAKIGKAGRTLDGVIDDLRIYDTVLTDQQISDIQARIL